MKPHFFILPFIAVSFAVQAFAQQYEETSSVLDIGVGETVSETNINRTVVEDEPEPDVAGRDMVGIALKSDASYEGTNVNLTVQGNGGNGDDNNIGVTGISALAVGFSINLTTSGEDIWNTITVSTAFTENSYLYGIHTQATGGVAATCSIANTKINVIGTGSVSGLALSGTDTVLDNVNFDLSILASTENNVGLSGSAIAALNNTTVINKGQVTIAVDFGLDESDVVDGSNGVIRVINSSTVDLHDATISITNSGYPASYSVLAASYAGTISLTQSSISSYDGNTLISDGISISGYESFVNLNEVNLDNAKNQAISFRDYSTLHVNLSNGTNLDGYAQQVTDEYSLPEDGGSLLLSIASGSSWNVTQDSTTGLAGSLTLDGASMISFEQLSEGSFTNITSVSIALESGAILMLGATTEEIRALLDGNGGTYDVKLFTTDDEFSNEGVVLVTSDGQKLEYTTDNLGTYTLLAVIPEPTTISFGLAALGLLALRRRGIKK